MIPAYSILSSSSALNSNLYEAWVEALGPFIGQLHLHDNSGGQDEHLPIGGGAIDFRMLFKKLANMRKDPPIITMEPHREEDLRPSVECLEKIWPW